MATFFTSQGLYAVATEKGSLKVISKSVYDAMLEQYRAWGWREENFEGLTHFFPRRDKY